MNTSTRVPALISRFGIDELRRSRLWQADDLDAQARVAVADGDPARATGLREKAARMRARAHSDFIAQPEIANGWKRRK